MLTHQFKSLCYYLLALIDRKESVNKKQFISIAITITLFSLAWIIFTPVFFPIVHADGLQTAPHRGFFAPPFNLTTPQGDIHTLANYQGAPVLIIFWASWCSVCKSTLPGLEAVYRDYAPQGFAILAVNTTNQDNLSEAKAYFQSQAYTFTMLLDPDGAVANAYQMRAVPTSILVDSDGKISDVIIGSELTEGLLRVRLESLFTQGED